jgi:hypothetical protein
VKRISSAGTPQRSASSTSVLETASTPAPSRWSSEMIAMLLFAFMA